MTIGAANSRGIALFFGVCLAFHVCYAQDLVPRAYVITPINANTVVLGYSFSHGNILFDQTLPLTDAKGTISVPNLSLYHAFNFFGRSANITATLPYTVGNFQANVTGNFQASGTTVKVYRSGLMDSVFRFSVNIKGGPALSAKEFRAWRQKTIVGASLKVVAPTGQYDPTVLINPGNNRWAFRPELGYSRRWDNWILDGYGAVWFFTTNPEFFSHNRLSPGVNTQSQGPIYAFEGHLSYSVKPRLWASLDGNFWRGGRTSLNGVVKSTTLQQNSRIGGTVSVPLTTHQSLKFNYNYGDYIRFGGNYHNISAAWQYLWIGRPWKHKQKVSSAEGPVEPLSLTSSSEGSL